MTLRQIMAKSVCIIGAGPSGIIAAKTLLHEYPHGTFTVTVFEQSQRIGGLWPLSPADDGMVNPEMSTNLSRHTVSFSDMAWPESSPIFPKAWQAGQYLENYISKYPGLDIRTSSKVLGACRLPEVATGAKRWKIEVEKKATSLVSVTQTLATSVDTMTTGQAGNGTASELKNSSVETHHFDHCIVASGFFGRPKLPSSSSRDGRFSAPIRHSTQFRGITSLLEDTNADSKSQGSKILVIGGSMSGAEVAASIAMQLSSQVHSPETSSITNVGKYTVHHIIRRPFWVMPLFLPVIPILETDLDLPKSFNPAPTFLPLDLIMYNLAKRPPGPIKNNSGHITHERAGSINQYLESIVGTDQNDLINQRSSDRNGALAMRGEILEEAPWLAISDTYAEFVRSGQIVTSTGRLTSFNGDSCSPSASVTISSGPKEQIVDDLAAVVLATGFEASGSLSFLPEDVLRTLDYDPSCPPLPLDLDIHSTVHHSIPDLGFVGFYRGPFWGVMEMQARYLGALWTGDEKATKALYSHTSPIPALRKCYYDSPRELAQFPMGDYTYLMESFRSILSIDHQAAPRQGPVLPARYLLPSASSKGHAQSLNAISAVENLFTDSTENKKLVARAIFRSLQGDWSLQRSLISSIATYPSGTLSGGAKFYPRSPTDPSYDSEYLYFEEGDFETSTGLKFRANRRYSYRYNEATDKLSVWFVKTDNKSVDYLFHELEILAPEVEGEGWKARAHHLCIEDTYDVRYEFRFRGAGIEEWRLAYGVRGPQKDYRIESVYRRGS